ncbi:MAG: SIMPL domain-containing protein [Chitinophagales bacterium]|nr:SIMPL domain-containing protein [Chitinophagales bacterium]
MKKELTIGILILLSVCLGTFILGKAYNYKYNISNNISVTGSAKMNFDSDIVKWVATFSRINIDLKTASEQLKSDKEKINTYLLNQGIPKEEIKFGAINIYREYDYHYDNNSGQNYQTFKGFNLSQEVSIESNNLDKIDNISREISDLISEGIELSSEPANYYYSKLEDLKLELIANASENALQRAKNIAVKSNSKLDGLVSADLGVFQITGQNDNDDYSYGGVFNTKARQKTASITIRAKYKIK